MSRADINRRVEVSADIADSVYKFEEYFVKNSDILSDKSDENIDDIEEVLNSKKAPLPPNTELKDYYYDPSTGVAAIAVYDSVTGETYIAYAGTNMGADGSADVISDVNIGFNNSLALKKLEESATSFYREVQKSGANVTVTTGHSFGDFISTRVAIVEQTPYKFGYQGAPQSVSVKTILEMNYDRLLSYKVLSKEELDKLIVQEEIEEQRVNQLISNYSGYAVTFSTTADALTNALWDQKPNEIDFDGKTTIKGFHLDGPKDLLLNFLAKKFDTKLEAVYVGNVIAIDVPIEHDMSAYKNSMEAMHYTTTAVLSDLNSVDFNRDGVADFVLSPEYLVKTPIIPAWASGGAGSTINLDLGVLEVVATNLRGISTYLSDLLTLNGEGISANQQVVDGVNQRKESYKETISEQLESIALVQAVKDIDSAFEQIVDLETMLSTIVSYDSYEFSRRFDNWGSSIFYSWYKENGSSWNYNSVVNSLTRLSIGVGELRSVARNNSDVGPSKYGGIFSIGTRTNVARRGEELINSFEEEIESVTKGIGNRSSYSDGIPLAIGEVLDVIHFNLQAVIQCVNYTVEVVEKIKDAMISVDAQLASDITKLDLSLISPVDVSIYTDYQTFLESTGVFDDMSVLKAYDDQIDKKAEELANSMSTEFSNYLSEVSSEISSTNSLLSTIVSTSNKLTNQMETNVYYKEWGEKEKHYYGRVGDFISISYAISRLQSESSEIDRMLTTASTKVNTVVGALGNLYEPFRRGAEDAIYGLSGLEAIVKAQLSISEVLLSMKSRFEEMKVQISSNQGVAVNALGEKMDEIISLMSTSEQLITDCFGN
ncbi:SA1320 family protein [Streptococcus suis]|uniref:Lipase n=1 Tax=Streptococcus suis TaxID=1307 RepID=A0A123U1B7_STRSU|nr:hypothetical protein [Streptococcus suis]CYV88895.1 lipase [Streptococcus suis]